MIIIDLFIYNVQGGRSRELWVCKELDYDEGRRLRTFITVQNSLERRMIVLYGCHIFVLWCNWNDDLPDCSVLKSKLERLSLCKEINLTKWCIFYSKCVAVRFSPKWVCSYVTSLLLTSFKSLITLLVLIWIILYIFPPYLSQYIHQIS